jgi:hypothetical protein
MTDRPLTWDLVPPEELAELRFLLQPEQTWQKSSMCQDKHPFPSRTSALSSISWGKRHEIHPYHCPLCKRWHVGSRKNVDSKRKAIRSILNTKREEGECE